MERISVGDLPDGTTTKTEKTAKLKGFLKKNGKPNLSQYVKHLILEGNKR